MNRQLAGWMFIVAAVLCFAAQGQALGFLYPAGRSIALPAALTGLDSLVNSPARTMGVIGGELAEYGLFYYAGDTAAFNAFLKRYAEIEGGIPKHRLIIEPGKGIAPGEGDTKGRPCDWRLDATPQFGKDFDLTDPKRLAQALAEVKYDVALHVWTEGKVDLTAVEIPRNVEVVGKLPSPPAGYRTDVKVTPAGAPHTYAVNFEIVEVGRDGKSTVLSAPKMLVNAGALATLQRAGDAESGGDIFCTAQVKEAAGWVEVTTSIILKVKGVEKLNSAQTVSLHMAAVAPGAR